MDKDEIISSIISAHENDDNGQIRLHEGLELKPMLKHTGRMSVHAYTMGRYNGWRKWRRLTNANRRYVGMLDFKIIDNSGGMEHDELLKEVLKLLSPDDVANLYHGKDPGEMGFNDEQEVVARNLLCAFIEQEVNWGVNDFQLHTNFGNTEFNWKNKCEYLEDAVPRDYFCSHILFLFNELQQAQNQDVESIVKPFLKKWMRATVAAANKTIMPPILNERVVKSHREFMLSYMDESVRPWIEPYLERISRLSSKIGNNPRWDKFYLIDGKGNVNIIVDHPYLDRGLSWPTISLEDEEE